MKKKKNLTVLDIINSDDMACKESKRWAKTFGTDLKGVWKDCNIPDWWIYLYNGLELPRNMRREFVDYFVLSCVNYVSSLDVTTHDERVVLNLFQTIRDRVTKTLVTDHQSSISTNTKVLIRNLGMKSAFEELALDLIGFGLHFDDGDDVRNIYDTVKIYLRDKKIAAGGFKIYVSQLFRDKFSVKDIIKFTPEPWK